MKLELFNFPKLEVPKLLSWIMTKNYYINCLHDCFNTNVMLVLTFNAQSYSKGYFEL